MIPSRKGRREEGPRRAGAGHRDSFRRRTIAFGRSAGWLLVGISCVWLLACQQRSAQETIEPAADPHASDQDTSPGDETPSAAGAGAPAGGAAPDTPVTRAASDTPVTREEAAPEETAPAETAPAQADERPAQAGGADVYDGWRMYAVTCERCHGQDALGSALAPDLRKSAGALGHDGFVEIVRNGRPDKGMPAFGDVLEPQQIENIYAYAVARGTGELGPGRPPRSGD